MGQKVHPLGFRVGITKKHQSQWFARFNKYKYSQSILEDRMIRETLSKLFPELLNPINPYGGKSSNTSMGHQTSKGVAKKGGKPSGSLSSVAYSLPQTLDKTKGNEGTKTTPETFPAGNTPPDRHPGNIYKISNTSPLGEGKSGNTGYDAKSKVEKKRRDDEIAITPRITQIKIERGLIPYEIGIQIHAENCDLLKSSIDNLKVKRELIIKLQKTRRYLFNLKLTPTAPPLGKVVPNTQQSFVEDITYSAPYPGRHVFDQTYPRRLPLTDINT